MLLTLRKTYYKDDSRGILSSGITFEVDYCPQSGNVETINKVLIHDVKKGTKTDVTALLWDQFTEQLAKMVETIDWKAVYADSIINPIIHTT